MPTIKKDNPAGRLFHLLMAAKADGMSNCTMGQMCTKVFSIKPEDTVKISEFRRLIIRLIDDTKNLIKRRVDLNHALFLESLPEIKNKMEGATIESQWSVVAEVITDKALTELSFCSEVLANLETPIAPSELEGISQQVEGLAGKNLENHHGEEEVGELIMALLEIIRRGIRDYKVIGAIALQESLAVCIGRLFVMRSPGFMEEKETALLTEMKNILMNIDLAIGKALDYRSCFESVAPFLPGLAMASSQCEENGKTMVR